MGTPMDDLRNAAVELSTASGAYGRMLDDLAVRDVVGSSTDALRVAQEHVQAAWAAYMAANERWLSEA